MKSRHLSLLVSGSTLVSAVMAANVVSLFFNAYLGRVVTPETFGVLALITTFLYIGSIFYNALAAMSNREVSYLSGKYDVSRANDFFISIAGKVTIVSGIVALLWFLAVPYTTAFFHISSPVIFYLFTPVLLFYPFAALGRGYFQGRFFFISTAFLVLIEPVIKLVSAFFFIFFQDPEQVYMAIYLSAVLTGILALVFLWYKKVKIKTGKSYSFPLLFFGAAILTGLSTVSFLVIDMILVKHFLSPVLAGQYAFLSLLGKIIFFSGTLLNVFTISLVSREVEGKKNPFLSFYWLFLGAVCLTAAAFVVFGVFGSFSIPLLFSEKANAIIPYAIPYVLALSLFTLSSVIVTYHLAKKQYIFPLVALGMSAFIIIGMLFSHQNITQIVYILLSVSIFYSITLAIMHIKMNFFSSKISLSRLEESI